MSKRGLFFTADALIAVMIIFFVLIVFVPIINKPVSETEVHQDLLVTLSDLKISDVNNSYVQGLIAGGQISNLDNSVLEQIGEFYVVDENAARLLAQEVLGDLNLTDNVGIWYGSTLIYSSNKTAYENAENVETARQIITGIQQGESVTGFSARAFLSNSLIQDYFYFGGYIGDGNLTVNTPYTGNITTAEIEFVASDDFDLYVNGILTLNDYAGSVDEFTPVNYSIPITSFHSGQNIINVRGNNIHVAGGFVKIIYEADVSYNESSRYYFSGVEGLINVYDGFYVPGDLNSLNVYLHMNSSVPVFLTLGNTTIYNNATNGTVSVSLSNSYLSSILSYNSLSEKTVPLRLGLENVSYTGSNQRIDVFSVTDLSGSMIGAPLADAKNATIGLIDFILNSTGNRVGLVGYSSSATDTNFHVLSDNETSLNSKVSSWTASGTTCICCGINKAVQGFLNDSLLPPPQSLLPDLMVYYNFNGDVKDKSGNGYNGTISGNPTYVSSSLDGSDLNYSGADSVTVPDIVNFSQGSISLWVKPSTMKSQTIFDMSTSTKFFYVDIDSSKKLRVRFEDANDADFIGISYDISSYPAGQWHHIVVNWGFNSSSPAAELYWDGVLVAQDNGAPSAMPDFLSPSIGNKKTGGSSWDFRGDVDEFRLYSKRLSSAEVQGLFDQTDSCGNSLIEVGEVCDGNYEICTTGGNVGRKNCDSFCSRFSSCDTTNVCGDGIVTSGEACDDGNFVNGDGCSSSCSLEERFKSMIVMSDGIANVYCPQQNTGDPAQDAIQAACDAYQDYGIRVFSVGFGSGVNEDTLISIASCGNGSYYYSGLGNLTEIYKQIANEIITNYLEQTIGVSGGQLYTQLYEDSYIDYSYNKTDFSFPLIITLESLFEDSYFGQFFVPEESTVLEAKVASYSGPKWTNKLLINGNEVYDVNNYGSNYIYVGDPYFINIPDSLVLNGTNVVNLTTAVSQTNVSGGSPYNKIIYTIAKNVSVFSPVLSSAEGCIWNIEFTDGSSITVPVPLDYSGSEQCYYNSSVVGDVGDQVVDENDALQIATLNLLSELDINGDGKIDFLFNENDLEIDLSQVTGIPFTWSTEVQARRWT